MQQLQIMQLWNEKMRIQVQCVYMCVCVWCRLILNNYSSSAQANPPQKVVRLRAFHLPCTKRRPIHQTPTWQIHSIIEVYFYGEAESQTFPCIQKRVRIIYESCWDAQYVISKSGFAPPPHMPLSIPTQAINNVKQHRDKPPEHRVTPRGEDGLHGCHTHTRTHINKFRQKQKCTNCRTHIWGNQNVLWLTLPIFRAL